MTVRFAAFVLVGAIVSPAVLQAQRTLGEASAAAKQIHHEWPVSTNQVPVFDPANALPVTDVLLASSVPVLPATPAVVDLKAQPEAWWKARMQTLTDQLATDAGLLTVATDRVTTARGTLGLATKEAAQATLLVELQHAEADRDHLTRAVAADDAAIASAQEEARVAGVLPGWLR
jgi:hypothetical protein